MIGKRALVYLACLALALAAAWPRAACADSGAAPAADGEIGELAIVGDDAFAPYSFLRDGKPVGIDVDILRAVAERAGVRVDIRLVPWKRLLIMLQKGQADGGFSLFETLERTHYALYAKAHPLHTSNIHLFVKPDKVFDFTSIKQLDGKLIGKNAGFSIGEDFDNMADAGFIRLREFTDNMMDPRRIVAAPLDGFVHTREVMRHMLKSEGLEGRMVALRKPVSQGRGAYFVLSRAATRIQDKEAMLARFDKALESFFGEGGHLLIISNYVR